jgi:hypothetical protein
MVRGGDLRRGGGRSARCLLLLTREIKTRGFRPPTTTYFLYMPKESRQRKGTQLPCPPLRSGFPSLRRRFGDRQKLASLRHLPVSFPKTSTPLRLRQMGRVDRPGQVAASPHTEKPIRSIVDPPERAVASSLRSAVLVTSSAVHQQRSRPRKGCPPQVKRPFLCLLSFGRSKESKAGCGAQRPRSLFATS